MAQWIECVPNISEGRRPEVIEAVAAAVRGVPGIVLLSVESDKDHNRTVITFAGPPGAVAEAAVRCAAEAKARIDLTRHEGAHPRMGACDVIPFVPLAGATMEDCVALARRVGERVARELEIPTYLYGEAAARPERRLLANVRKGQFEGMREAVGSDPARDPDFGPRAVHPTAGATAVGARFFLIAYNVNLKTEDVAVAKEIATRVREKDGGMPGVQGMGFPLGEKRCVQVSMNLLDYRKTSPQAAFDAVRRLAAERGVEVLESEMIGLLPRDAVDACFKEATLCANFTSDAVIEARIEKSRTALEAPAEFLDALAGKEPAPGGGSAAALAGAMGASLVAMIANLTLGKKKYAVVEERMRSILARAEALRAELFGLIRADTEAYTRVMEAYKLPQGAPERAAAVDQALQGAAAPPLRMAELCAETCELSAEAVAIGNRNAISDGGGGALLAEAAALLAADNVRINLGGVGNPAYRTETGRRLDGFLARAKAASARARAAVAEAIPG
ncbi:MAG: glutamate formimidoyltransferase [Planctomycetaceae bacterium]